MNQRDEPRELAIGLGNTVIGSAIMRPDHVAELAQIVRPEDFPQPRQGLIWQCITRRIAEGKPIDPLALTAEFADSGALGPVNVASIISALPGQAVPDAAFHAERLAIYSNRRAVGLAAARVQQAIAEGASSETIAKLVAEVSSLAANDRSSQASPTGRQLRLTRASEIRPAPVIWAWTDEGEGRVPAGAMTVAAGREGTGKSSFGIWMAAQITRGTLPGAFYGRPRAVFYVAVEDSWEQTIVPRLMGNDADLDLVYRVDAVESEFGETTVSLPQDNAMFEQLICDYDVALVVLDPLMSCIGKGIDTHRERDVRTALDPLARMADRTGAVLLGIAHFNKGSSTDPASLITGSGAFKNVPRAVFGFARDDDNECRVITQAKNSLGRSDLPSLAYIIANAEVPTDHGTANVGRFTLLGTSARTVDEILAAGPEGNHGEREDAVAWLRGYLTDAGGEAPAKDVKRAAAADDISERTLQRAMGKAGVETHRAGFGKGTIWRLDPALMTTASSGASPIAPQSRHSRQLPEAGANGANGGANGADDETASLSVIEELSLIDAGSVPV